MRNIRLVILSFILSSGLIYGCAENKQPAEKAKEASSQVAESAGEKPAVVKEAPAVPAETKEKIVEKKETAPAAAPAVKEKTASKQAPVQAAPVKEVLKEPAAPVKNIDAGASIFKAKCSPCHGAEGKGTTMAPALKGNNWIKGASNADIADVIKNGRKGAAKKYANFFVDMPASKGLAETDVNALAEYLKSMN